MDWFAQAMLKKSFYEICVDSSMTPQQVSEQFEELIQISFQFAGTGALVIAFLDEVNTSSVLGLFKEILVVSFILSMSNISCSSG